MESVPTLAEAIANYGWAAILALFVAATVKIYIDNQSLNKELREITKQVTIQNQSFIESLNKLSQALTQQSAALIELKATIQAFMDRQK